MCLQNLWKYSFFFLIFFCFQWETNTCVWCFGVGYKPLPTSSSTVFCFFSMLHHCLCYIILNIGYRSTSGNINSIRYFKGYMLWKKTAETPVQYLSWAWILLHCNAQPKIVFSPLNVDFHKKYLEIPLYICFFLWISSQMSTQHTWAFYWLYQAKLHSNHWCHQWLTIGLANHQFNSLINKHKP